jgi:hypothetical protein
MYIYNNISYIVTYQDIVKGGRGEGGLITSLSHDFKFNQLFSG